MLSLPVRYLAFPAVLAACLCTTVMNWRFAVQLSTNPFDAYVWGIFSVTLDICKWTMLPYAALGWPTHKLRATCAASIWLVATCYSFGAAIGFAAITRDAAIAARQAQAELHSTLLTMKQSPRWHASAACADVTVKASKDFCATYRALEAKLSTAPEHDDPQAELISRLFGLHEERARLALAFFMALACELVSALGLFAISAAPRLPKVNTSASSSEAIDADRPVRQETTPAIADPTTPLWRPRHT